MSANMAFLNRIGGWFRRGKNGEEVPGDGATSISVFRRPRANNEAVVARVQEGFTTLTDLMDGIRSNLAEGNQKQQQVLDYLAQLPEVVRSIPEQNRAHGEALRTIHQQLALQSESHARLANVLETMSNAGIAQREVLDDLQERIDRMRQTDQQIAENLNAVGGAMSEVSKSSSMSAAVLAEMRDGVNARDRDLERVLHRQGQRFTVLLIVAIFFSVAALVAVSVMGYLMLQRTAGSGPAPAASPAPSALVAPAR
jgi:valyl-tRNA synthetase